jgi:TIR domain-containing protein
MPSVFFSYARDDIDRIRPLIQQLEHEDVSVFWDDSLTVEADYADVIRRRIEQVDCVVVAWSRAASDSQVVIREASLARELLKLVPISVDASALPSAFSDLNTISFANWNRALNAPEFLELMRCISLHANATGSLAGEPRPFPDTHDKFGAPFPTDAPTTPPSGSEVVPTFEVDSNFDDTGATPDHDGVSTPDAPSEGTIEIHPAPPAQSFPSGSSGNPYGQRPGAAKQPWLVEEMEDELKRHPHIMTVPQVEQRMRSKGGILRRLGDLLGGAASRTKADSVECSVFAPLLVPAARDVLIQVFLHGQTPEDFARAEFEAQMMDPEAKLKANKTLDLDIPRGTRVQVVLSAAEYVEIEEPVQSVTWRGEPTFCQFLMKLPRSFEGRVLHPVIRILLDGKLIGRIRFKMKVGHSREGSERVLTGEAANRYRHAFLSYASEDRKEVLKRAQMLKASKIGFFQDVLSLDPGDRWEKEIYRNIDHCDLFLLFWSQSARESEWVIKETEYALARHNVGEGHVPDIVPILLEGPPPVLPPESLSSLHFNDPILYVIAAS